MSSTEKRMLWRSILIGVIVTLVVAATGWLGAFAPLERWLYDRRCRYFQHFAPAPTTQLVHVDIDDAALKIIGRWPWPRSKMAEIIDEIRLAGPKAIALDVILAEHEAPTTALSTPSTTGPAVIIDHDGRLSDALRAGRVIIPATFDPRRAEASGQTLLHAWLMRELKKNSELELEDLRQMLPPELGPVSQDDYVIYLRKALGTAISQECPAGPQPLEKLSAKILPRLSRQYKTSSPQRMLEQELSHFCASQALKRLVYPNFPDLTSLLRAEGGVFPASQLGEAADNIAFVNFFPSEDGVLRSVPLYLNYDDQPVAQLGLALACAYLGVDPRQIRMDADSITITRPGGVAVVIPVHTITSSDLGSVGAVFDVPYFGSGDWATMYDHPAHRSSEQHVPIGKVYEARENRRQIEHNNSEADKALSVVEQVVGDAPPATRAGADASALDGWETRRALIGWALRERLVVDALQSIRVMPPEKFAELSGKEQAFMEAARALETVLQQNEKRSRPLKEMRERLHGRAVLIGSTATAEGDVVATSLHPRCPGDIVHATIFSAIVTGHFWRPLPQWAGTGITLITGLLATLAVARLSGRSALIVSLLLLGGYVLVNGVILFDYLGLLTGAAGPLIVVGGVWSSITLNRFVEESSMRTRITRRFRTYVDPALVNYVMDHPERIRLEGQVRKMSVVFTDLTGFTAVAEMLKEQSVEVLNECMQQMVPIIRANGGYLNKFLGDGIMFFFGAPQENQEHATAAIAAALQMQTAMGPFNNGLAARGIPRMPMRIGISSGAMVVGDAGADDACDYTVLGDAVNLGARLEVANKTFGTSILVSAVTASFNRGRFLLRQVGRLIVPGKTEVVMVYEPICLAEQATSRQRDLADLTANVVTAFIAGEFQKCLDAVRSLANTFGESRLCELYRNLSTANLEKPPPDFNGAIVFHER